MAKSYRVKVGDTYHPVVLARDGVYRFPQNKIVRDLVDAGRLPLGLDMNVIILNHQVGRYTDDDLVQLYMLIGYSIEGFASIFDRGDERPEDACEFRPRKSIPVGEVEEVP